MNDQEKIAMAREYFIRADQGRPDLLELFHEDAEIYFPKFGRGFGRESFFEMVKGFEGSLEYIRHDYDTLNFMPSGDFVAVEGTSKGRTVRQVVGRRRYSRRTGTRRATWTRRTLRTTAPGAMRVFARAVVRRLAGLR